MTINSKQLAKTAAGSALLGAGVMFKLAEYGLSVSQVVLNGAENLADSFVKAPKLGIGKAFLQNISKGMHTLSDKLIKQGKGLCE